MTSSSGENNITRNIDSRNITSRRYDRKISNRRERDIFDFLESQKPEKLRELVESSFLVILVRKAEAGFPVDFISENVSLFGYEPSDFTEGKLLYSDLIHPEDLKTFCLGVLNNSERGIRNYTQEYRILTKDGKVRWVEDRTLAMYGQKGRIRDYIGFIRDITEQKELEKKLEYSEKKFKALLEYSEDGIIIHDRDGKFLEVNEASCKRLGYSREELLQMTPCDLDAKYKKSLLKLIKRSYREGETKFETAHMRKDGAIIPIEMSTYIMEYDGKATVLTVAKDISEQKKTEEELLYATKAWKVLETVVNNSSVVVFLCRPKHKWPVEFISGNINQFGYSVEEFTVGKLLFGDIIHPSDLERVTDNLIRNCSEGKDFTQEYRILTRDGKVRWVGEQTFIQTDENGETAYLQCAIMDITERKQKNEFLRVQCDLGIALTSVDDFNGTIEQLLKLALQVESVDYGCLYLVDRETGGLSVETHVGLSPNYAECISHYEGNSVIVRLLRNGQPIYKHHSEICALETHKMLKATAFLPISYQGKFVAALKLISLTDDEIPETFRNTLETIAAEIGVAIGRTMEKKELKTTCEDLESLLNAFNDFLLIVDTDGCIVYCNQTISKQLGYSLETLKGKNMLSLHPPNKAFEVANILTGIPEGKKSSFSIPFVSKKGVEIPAKTQISRGKWKGREVFIALSCLQEEA